MISVQGPILSFLIGLLLGAVNWLLLYKLYSAVMSLGGAGRLTLKHKLGLAFKVLLKMTVLFGGLYLVIVVFGVNVLYLLLGFVISLIGMIIFLFRMKN